MSKLRSVAGEFFVIVAGVLVALGVDEWRENLADQALEAEYLQRLRTDLESDTANFAWFERVLEAKESVLLDLKSDDPIRRLQGHENLIQDLVYSDFKALPSSQASTFRELQSTGNLKLIRDINLRGKISRYYLGFDHISAILATPSGDYRRLLSESIPGELINGWRLDNTPPDPGALERGLRTLLALPNIGGAVNAELAYTTGMAYYLGDYEASARALLEELDGS